MCHIGICSRANICKRVTILSPISINPAVFQVIIGNIPSL